MARLTNMKMTEPQTYQKHWQALLQLNVMVQELLLQTSSLSECVGKVEELLVQLGFTNCIKAPVFSV